MGVKYEKCESIIDYLKSVEISVKSDFIHADKSEGFIFKPINESDRPYLYVVKVDGVVAGAVVVRPIKEADYKMFKHFVPMPDSLILDKLVVKTWHRNIGLGGGLVEYITQQFADTTLYAIVRVEPEQNLAAIKICNKTGFGKVLQTKYFNKDFNDEAVWRLYQTGLNEQPKTIKDIVEAQPEVDVVNEEVEPEQEVEPQTTEENSTPVADNVDNADNN